MRKEQDRVQEEGEIWGGDELERRIYGGLRRHFGFREFREGQQAPVEEALRGRDSVVVMPTGSGKSLCYQLAALLLPGTTLVVSPLIALMRDQVEALTRRGLPATFVNTSVSGGEMERRLSGMPRGDYKLVYIAPERLANERFRAAIARTELSLLAVDEAHCISQWGHDFRPDYLNLRAELEGFPDLTVMATTATATPDVRKDIVKQLGLGVSPREAPYVQVQGFARDNLDLRVTAPRDTADKLRRVKRMVAELGTGIVYTATRKHAEQVSGELAASGVGEVLMYHGGMGDAERTEVQERFMAARRPVVVATNAFGMGVDRADIRFVAHWDMPGSIEAYYQEVGRAGRDGLPARCELLYDGKGVRLQNFFYEGANPPLWLAAKVLEHVEGLPGGAGAVNPEELAKEFHVHAPAVETVLNVLGQEKAVKTDRKSWLRGTGEGWVERNPEVGMEHLREVWKGRMRKAESDRRRLDAMIGFCTGGGCRHRRILEYFGEEAKADVCGGCDHCGPRQAVPPLDGEQWTVVQKALSCIRRLKGEADAEEVGAVLLGEACERGRQLGWESVSTWGLLKGFGAEKLGILLESLVRAGCAMAAGDGSGRLHLTAKGLRVARREEGDFTIRWPQAGRPVRRTARVRAPRETAYDLDAGGRVRFRELKKWRLKTARSMGVSSSRILGRTTLMNLAKRNPKTWSELERVAPAQTVETYGEELLGVLRDCLAAG